VNRLCDMCSLQLINYQVKSLMNELIASIDMNSKNRAIIYVDLHVWYILKKV